MISENKWGCELSGEINMFRIFNNFVSYKIFLVFCLTLTSGEINEIWGMDDNGTYERF